jgi:hypothetical protein
VTYVVRWLLALSLVSGSMLPQEGLAQTSIPANQDAHLILCYSNAATAVHHYHFVFSNPPPTTVTINGVAQSGLIGDTVDYPASPGCNDVVLTTTGVTTTTKTVFISGCNPNGCDQSFGNGQISLVPTIVPKISLDLPALIPESLGTSQQTVTVRSGTTSGPLFAAIPVTMTCTGVFGASVSPPTAFAYTGIDGKASFAVTVNRLIVPIAGGNPKVTCTFTATDKNGGNPSAVSVTANGQNVTPLLQTSPQNTALSPGVVNVFMSQLNPPIDMTGTRILATCSGSPAPTTALVEGQASVIKASNAAGQVSFSYSATGLVGVGSQPTAKCEFTYADYVGTSPKATLIFGTGNACTIPTIQPKPAACGNP